MLSVRFEDVEWLEAAENCVKLHIGKRTHRLRDPLDAVADKLPPGRFLRISPSILLNINKIAAVQPMLFDDLEVLLQNGKTFSVAPGYRDNLRQIGLPLPVSAPRATCSHPTARRAFKRF